MYFELSVWDILKREDIMGIFTCLNVHEDEEGNLIELHTAMTKLLKNNSHFSISKDPLKLDDLVDYCIYKSYYINKAVLTIYAHESFGMINESANNVVLIELTHWCRDGIYRVVAKGQLNDKVQFGFLQDHYDNEVIKLTNKNS